MLQILLHSSKTMRVPSSAPAPLGTPVLIDKARDLAERYASLPLDTLADIMKISPSKAVTVHDMYARWSDDPSRQTAAIDTFVGDIYSGLQTAGWSRSDRDYAHRHLVLLSGLYGAIRACDGIMPYRLEMAYKLPNGSSLYEFWGDAIAASLPAGTTMLVNLSAVEYTKALLPYTGLPVITPKFLTVSPKTGVPTFVTVHAKIARGAFAGWMVRDRIDDESALRDFTDLGYRYDVSASTSTQPVFVCDEFKGLGLSIRLTK